jgi:gamma-glutamyltranspeptidase/glutathione hydrolase
VALGIIEAVEQHHGIDVLELEHNSAAYLHILIEAMRLAFADSESQLDQPCVSSPEE